MMKFSYIKARPKSHPFPIVAWLIMMFQGEFPWNKNATSHRALGYWLEESEWVLDSTGAEGVKDQLRVAFEKKYKIIEETVFELTLDPNEFINWMTEHLGKKYDRLQIIGLITKILNFVEFNKLGHDDDKIVCNEIVVLFFMEFLGLKVIDSDNWDLNMTDIMVERCLSHVH